MNKTTYLLFTFFAAGIIIFFGAGCTAGAKKAYHEKRADQFFADGDWDKAEIEYLNTIRLDERDTNALDHLVKIYFGEGRLLHATYWLHQALDVSTNNPDLRLTMGLLKVSAGDYNGARDTANFVLDERPADNQAPLLLAEAANNPAEATKAKMRLQKLAAAHDSASLEVALGNLALRELDLTGAEAHFRHAVELDPKSPEAQSAMGAWYAHNKDLKSADNYFKAAADASPPRSQWRIQYAEFKYLTGDINAAKDLFESIIKNTPQQIPALQGLAQISFQQKKYDETDQYLKKVFDLESDELESLILLAQLQIAQKDPAAAVATMKHGTLVYPQTPVIFYNLAMADFAAGQNEEAVASIEETLKLDQQYHQDATDATILLAELRINMGKPVQALALLEQVGAKAPSAQWLRTQILMADVQKELGNYLKAVEIYNSLEKVSPPDDDLELVKGSTLVLQADAENDPSDRATDLKNARQAFNRAFEINSNNLPALAELIGLDVNDKQFAAAQNRLQKELAKNPNSVELHLLLAQVFVAEKNYPQAEATWQKTIDIAPNDPRAYTMLGRAYYDDQQMAKALQMFDKVTQRNPKSTTAWFDIATIQSAQKNYEQAAAAYEKVLLSNPVTDAEQTNLINAADNLAYIYSENLNRLDRAYELAEKAHLQSPYDPAIADTLGWILVKQAKYSEALAILKPAVEQMGDDPDVEFHFGFDNYMLGNEEAARMAFLHALQTGKDFDGRSEAQACLSILGINSQTADNNTLDLLEKRISQNPHDPVALERLAAIYQRDGKIDKAISTYETILQSNPNNLSAMINLTQLYMADKDRAKAYALAQAAYHQAPDNAEAMHLLGQLTFQAGDYQSAFSLLSQTVRNQPDNTAAQLDLARAAYSLGKIPDTQSALQSALPNLTGASAVEARRMNDLINLAANPSQAVAAQARIAEILKNEPDYVPALVVQQVIQKQNGNLAAAKSTGEKILSLYPDFAPEQKELAQLYVNDPGKLDRAYLLSVKARAIFPNDPMVAKTYGIISFQQKNYSSALDALSQSASQIQNDGELLFYLGSAQAQLKRPEAKATLQQALTLKLTPEQTDAAKKMLAQLK